MMMMTIMSTCLPARPPACTPVSKPRSHSGSDFGTRSGPRGGGGRRREACVSRVSFNQTSGDAEIPEMSQIEHQDHALKSPGSRVLRRTLTDFLWNRIRQPSDRLSSIEIVRLSMIQRIRTRCGRASDRCMMCTYVVHVQLLISIHSAHTRQRLLAQHTS